MRMHRPVTALVTAAALALVVTGCGSDGDDPAANGGGTQEDGTFAVDTSACPPEATKKLEDGETLKIGTVWPLSGPYAVLGAPIVQGMQVYVDKVNAEGGVDGHELELVAEDDAYDPTKTLPLVTELISKEKVFATLGQGGSPNVAAAQPLAEQSCTPQIWAGSGAAQFSDPAKHPWTISGFLSYTTEAQSWADYIKAENPDAKVAYLELENEGGKAYADGFSAAAEKNGLEIVASEKHSPTAATVENEVTNLLAGEPDVVIVMSVASSCAKAMGALAQGGYRGKTIAAYTCGGAAIFPLLGPAAEGAEILSITKPIDDTSNADIKQFVDAVAEYGDGAKADDEMLTGYRVVDLFVKNAEAASKLEGGLTRANLMNAAWNLDAPAFAAWGGRALVDGEKDPFVIESGQMIRWDAAKKSFTPTGDAIDREGMTNQG